MASKSEVQWPPESKNDTLITNFKESKEFLLKGDTDRYLSRLIGTVEVDYKPIEKILGLLTKLVHRNFGPVDDQKPIDDKKQKPMVSVIPRGSFATRTAIKGHVDLDIDVIFPHDYQMGSLGTIRKALGEDEASGNILFEKDRLKAVLEFFYTTLIKGTVPAKDIQLTSAEWLTPAKDMREITRSLSLKTKQIADLPEIPIDVFIKVRTNIRGQDVIIGLDKDSLAGTRRYQTTSFMPTEGKWVGDRTLSAVDRVALLSLKWWKNDLHDDKDLKFAVRGDFVPKPLMGPLTFDASKVEIKSHHLLTALNALHELDAGDKLYVPINSSEPFSLYRVKDVMYKVLEYLNRAYHPESRTVMWTNNGQEMDYFVPEDSYQTMERLFMQIRADWSKFCYLQESNVIATFIQEIVPRLQEQHWEK